VICPHVDTPERFAILLTAATMLPWDSGALHERHSPCLPAHTQKEYVEWANANTLVVIQPETQKALDNIEKLVSIPGVDAVMIAPMTCRFLWESWGS